ncbi:hypothetical protein AMAG_19585, partial [Allomyces macrogynus ATCC 38327]
AHCKLVREPIIRRRARNLPHWNKIQRWRSYHQRRHSITPSNLVPRSRCPLPTWTASKMVAMTDASSGNFEDDAPNRHRKCDLFHAENVIFSEDGRARSSEPAEYQLAIDHHQSVRLGT